MASIAKIAAADAARKAEVEQKATAEAVKRQEERAATRAATSAAPTVANQPVIGNIPPTVPLCHIGPRLPRNPVIGPGIALRWYCPYLPIQYQTTPS